MTDPTQIRWIDEWDLKTHYKEKYCAGEMLKPLAYYPFSLHEKEIADKDYWLSEHKHEIRKIKEQNKELKEKSFQYETDNLANRKEIDHLKKENKELKEKILPLLDALDDMFEVPIDSQALLNLRRLCEEKR